MSVFGFHAQFKAVTAMSPLQFQKHIRLQEARRLIIANDLDAASAGRRVGYEDASHFTREYKRLFGDRRFATRSEFVLPRPQPRISGVGSWPRFALRTN